MLRLPTWNLFLLVIVNLLYEKHNEHDFPFYMLFVIHYYVLLSIFMVEIPERQT